MADRRQVRHQDRVGTVWCYGSACRPDGGDDAVHTDSRYPRSRTVPGDAQHRDELLAELVTWIDEQQIADLGHFFLRLYVVDMAGMMDLEGG